MKKSDPPLVAGGGFGCHRKFKLTVIVLLLFAGGNGLPVKAAAQSAGDPPSVMDRIREKVRERPKPPPADWFHRLDTNRDRRISKIEVNVSINRRFSVLDTNRDGKISRDEFRVRNTIPGQSGPSFDQMDIDRNGNLSMVEFSAPVLWRFTPPRQRRRRVPHSDRNSPLSEYTSLPCSAAFDRHLLRDRRQDCYRITGTCRGFGTVRSPPGRLLLATGLAARALKPGAGITSHRSTPQKHHKMGSVRI